MITIKDIAREAGVSEGTVDRVLHNRGGVSKKTEASIKEILESHDFKVNPVASALAMKNKFNVATLMPNYDSDNLFWKSPYLGVLKASQEVANYGIKVNNFTFDQFDSSSYLSQFKILMESNPTAVILVPVFIKETQVIIDKLEKLNIPYLFFNIDLNGFNNISFIGQDSYLGGYVAGKVMHLSLHDKTSILVVQTRLNVTNYHHISKRIEGFNDYFIKNDFKVDTLILKIDNLKDIKKAKQKINSYLKEHGNIKGIFVPSSRISHIANSIDETYLDKIQLVGFDNTPQNIKCLEEDKISFLISQKPFDQGYESIHVMTDYLVKKKEPVSKIYSPIDILTKENARYNDRKKTAFEIENREIIA